MPRIVNGHRQTGTRSGTTNLIGVGVFLSRELAARLVGVDAKVGFPDFIGTPQNVNIFTP